MAMSKLELMRRLGATGQPGLFLSAGGYFAAPVGQRFVFVQADPQAVWTIPHNLGCRPCVTLMDESGNQVYADVQYVSDDIVRVTHGRPQAGQASCV